MKNLKVLEFDLELKEQRAMYWEKFHKIPAMYELTKNKKAKHQKKQL